jgi:hypothetical protein
MQRKRRKKGAVSEDCARWRTTPEQRITAAAFPFPAKEQAKFLHYAGGGNSGEYA